MRAVGLPPPRRGPPSSRPTPARRKNAAILQKGSTDTEAFWKLKKVSSQWRRMRGRPSRAGRDRRRQVDDCARATVAQACGQCHGVYRERFDDGSFRVKK
jgi:hypothetical protein